METFESIPAFRLAIGVACRRRRAAVADVPKHLPLTTSTTMTSLWTGTPSMRADLKHSRDQHFIKALTRPALRQMPSLPLPLALPFSSIAFHYWSIITYLRRHHIFRCYVNGKFVYCRLPSPSQIARIVHCFLGEWLRTAVDGGGRRRRERTNPGRIVRAFGSFRVNHRYYRSLFAQRMRRILFQS